MLKACGYTRRAQAVTWKVWEDLGSAIRLLQRMWFRGPERPAQHGGAMRSNDAYKAAFMNMYAFIETASATWPGRSGVEVGEYCHMVDSFHIYGSYFGEFEGFLRWWRTAAKDGCGDTAYGLEMFIEGCDTLLAEPTCPPTRRRWCRPASARSRTRRPVIARASRCTFREAGDETS